MVDTACGCIRRNEGDVFSAYYYIIEVCCVGVHVNLMRFPPVKADGLGFYHCVFQGNSAAGIANTFRPFHHFLGNQK
jgi:hypothetical protein